MKLLNPKIKAFTIAEMLVVLVLSTILILLAMSVLNLVQKEMKLVEKNYDTNNTIRTFERLLWKDFNQYDMYFDMNNENLIGINPKDSIRYLFNENYILRNTDTIRVRVHKKSLFLEAERVKAGRIDAIELELFNSQRSLILFCFQTKDASYYINNGF